MKDKSPMEYLMEFFLSMLKVVTDAVKQIAMAAYDARQRKTKEDKKNEKVDVNKSKSVMKKKYPKEIEKQMSKDNMDISVEEYDKLSKDDKKKKVAEWKSLTEKEKQERRDKFAKKQMPKLQEAVNQYYDSQVKQVKEISDLLPMDGMNITRGEFNKRSKKDQEYFRAVWADRDEENKKKAYTEFMEKQQPLIDEAVKKHAPGVYKKVTNDLGEVSLFTHKEQLLPKRVADEMAMELYDVNGKLNMILPVSAGEWEKMNAAQRRNQMNSWQKLSPEEQRSRLAAFEKQAKFKMQQAWQDYSKSTGDLITGETNVFTYTGQASIDAYDKLQEEKKMSEKERQKNELQDQKNDGKKDKENEIEKPKENNKDLTVGNENEMEETAPTKSPTRQGFSGRRRENNQLNQELNQQVNNLKQDKENEKDLFKAQHELEKNTAQVQNDVQAQNEIWKDEEEREKFREQVKEGASKRQENAAREKEIQKANEKDSAQANNDRPMMPNNLM
ncbi:MAG: hypothetical protein II800_05175 [Lachnospiraceae bacterium]|nr:hypothetical protein [Lachnospiraceae bacterium]